jgi:hypothetical protein
VRSATAADDYAKPLCGQRAAAWPVRERRPPGGGRSVLVERELLLTAKLGADMDADRESPQANVVDVDEAPHITLRRGR